MPATAAQVFGPTTVDLGFTTAGEKILLMITIGWIVLTIVV
jgi:hypothetical protein